MSSYLTTSTAASTYQTLSGMSSYLTTSAAASTYQPIGSYLTDAPSDGNEYVRKNAAWAVASAGGGVAWGAITGTLSSQTDLQTALDDKLALSGGTMTGGLTLSATGIIFSDATTLTTAPAGSALAADQLTAGVVTANPTTGPTTAGDVLQYDGTDLIWAAGGGGGGLTISSLSNGATSTLDATVPTSGQALSYNGTDLIWETPVAPGPSVSSTVSTAYSSHTLVAGDANNFVHIDQAAYVNVYIPQDSTYNFPIGTIVRIAVENTSYLTVSPGTYGTNPNVNGANTNQPQFVTSGGSQVINCVKVAADRWVVS
jgi:hypothetical protein